MVAGVVALLIAVIPALFIAEVIAKRRRLASWKRRRGSVGDDEFYASLAPVSLNRDEAVRVRFEVARATRIPVDLIPASDTISELETVGNCSHASILDYFADLLPVEKPKNESVLGTVRDLVIEFGPQFR